MTAEVALQPLTVKQARALTDAIQRTLKTGHELIVEAFKGRAWEVLGYESWDAYCAKEFNDARMVRLDREQRREIVAEMRDSGMSTRAIASGVGVDHKTVVNDLHRPTGESSPVGRVAPAGHSDLRPATITGLNGKRYTPPPPRPEPRVDRSTGEVDPTPRTPPRRALTDSYLDAVMELTKAVERIQRLTADDRFPRNAEQVAAKHHSDLTRAVDVLTDVLNRYLNSTVRTDVS